MAIGNVSKPSNLFNITKGSYQHNDYQTSTSVSSQPAKEGDKKDPKQGTQSFGPSGVVEYGTGKAEFEKAVWGSEVQNTTTEFNGPGGSGAYAGQTRALEARARWNQTVDTNPMDDGKIVLGIDGQAQANLFRTDHGVDYKSPAARYADHDIAWFEGHASGGALVGAQVDGAANLNLSFSPKIGASARVGAFAGALVRAEGEARGFLGGASAGVHARGEAFAGAQAWAEAKVGLTGLKASAGAFAGASAGGAVGADVMGVGVEASGEVWAGAGAKASVNVSWEDGKITFGAEAGAALGVGASGGVNVTIDTDRMIREGQAVWNTATGIAEQAAQDAARLAGDAYTAAAGFAGDAARAAGETVDALARAAENTARAAADAAGAAAGAAADAAGAAAQAAQDAADAAAQAASDAADAAAQAAQDAADAAARAAQDAADAAGQAASDVWNWLTGG